MSPRARVVSRAFRDSGAQNYREFHHGVCQPSPTTIRRRVVRQYPAVPSVPWTPPFVRVVPRALKTEVAFHLGVVWKKAMRRLPSRFIASHRLHARTIVSPAVHNAVMTERVAQLRSMEELYDMFGAHTYARPTRYGGSSCLVVRGYMANREAHMQPGTAGRRPFIVLAIRPLLSQVFVLDSRDTVKEVFPGLPRMAGRHTECPTDWLGVDAAVLKRTGQSWGFTASSLLINSIGGHG
jgi:hypothetical protein